MRLTIPFPGTLLGLIAVLAATATPLMTSTELFSFGGETDLYVRLRNEANVPTAGSFHIAVFC